MGNIDFLLGLLDEQSPQIAAEDLDGEHGAVLQLWQTMGFLGKDPSMNPVPGCPHCGEGVPYRLEERLICNTCRSTVDLRCLLLWPIDRDAFLRWLAGQWQLRGKVGRIDDHLWQLGTWVEKDGQLECFFRRSGELSAPGKTRLLAYRNTLLVFPRTPVSAGTSPSLSLLEAVRMDDSMEVVPLTQLLRARGAVRFDAGSGALWLDGACLGDVPVGSKEYHLLCCLAADQDRFVAYADLKHHVLRQTGSRDTTDEASFCQKLKGRIKARVPKIDLLIATTNKGDGYQLRAGV